MASRQHDPLDEVERLIAQAEGHRTALNAAVIGLTAAGGDVAEAEGLLRSIGEVLATLRRQRWAIPARAVRP